MLQLTQVCMERKALRPVAATCLFCFTLCEEYGLEISTTERRLQTFFHFYMETPTSNSWKKGKEPTFFISFAVLFPAPIWTMLRGAEMFSGEKKIFSFVFTLIRSLKKSRQNLALAALSVPTVTRPRPATAQPWN